MVNDGARRFGRHNRRISVLDVCASRRRLDRAETKRRGCNILANEKSKNMMIFFSFRSWNRSGTMHKGRFSAGLLEKVGGWDAGVCTPKKGVDSSDTSLAILIADRSFWGEEHACADYFRLEIHAKQ
jgi:hypothetical protein